MSDKRAELDALFREYRPRLFAWLARRIPFGLRRRIDPDDVLQEAFVRALHTFTEEVTAQGNVAPKVWLYSIVRDCYLEQWQRHTRDCRDHRKDEPWPDQSSMQQDLGRVGEATTPSEAAARTEERQRVLEVVQQLSAPDRELLEWHWWEGFSHGEVAAVLHVAEQAARQRYCRAFRRFSELWQQQVNCNGKTT
jgi:RNA polymerase sigma factor (sigma-70 family)